MASAKIKFEGGVYNLSQMGKFTTDVDRERRKKASKAVAKFFEKHHAEIGQIYDDLVHTRDNMAKKLGFKNYLKSYFFILLFAFHTFSYKLHLL